MPQLHSIPALLLLPSTNALPVSNTMTAPPMKAASQELFGIVRDLVIVVEVEGRDCTKEQQRCGRCVGNARTRVSLSITTGKQRLGDLCIFNLDRNLFESCSDCRADRVCWINLQEIVFWLMNIVIVSSAYY